MTSKCSTPKFGLLSIDTIANSHPQVIASLLQKYNLPGCVIPSVGYCDFTGCNVKPNAVSPPNIAQGCLCAFFTLLANFELGSIKSMYCLMMKPHSLNVATSQQDIIVGVKSFGNISNTDLNTSQKTSVEIVPITSTKVQTGLANASYKSMVDIIDVAEQDLKKNPPELFADPVSQDIIKTLKEYVDNNKLREAVKEGVTTAVSTISTSIKTFTTSKQIIRININASSDIKNAKIDLNQEQTIKVLVENITDISLGTALQKTLQNKINTIIRDNEYCSIKSYPPSEENDKNNKNLYISLGVAAFILFIILYMLWRRRKKQQQENQNGNQIKNGQVKQQQTQGPQQTKNGQVKQKQRQGPQQTQGGQVKQKQRQGPQQTKNGQVKQQQTQGPQQTKNRQVKQKQRQGPQQTQGGQGKKTQTQ